MFGRKPTRIVELQAPTQCVLWNEPQRASGRFAGILDEVECYEDSSHLTRSLYRCRECGQLYFFEWYEWVDWEEGNDKQYSTMIPVQTPDEIAALRDTDSLNLLRYFPRLQWDRGVPQWTGKG